MQWSMPRRVLQVVAVLIGLLSVSAFAAGIINAPSRGRMPGEKVGGQAGAAALVATDATPLGADRIEGATQARELTPEEKERLEAEKEAKEEADDAVKAAAATAPPGVNVPAAPSSPAAIPSEAPPAPAPDEAPH
ncbi:MAG: hypothetical protein ACXWKO_18655 [Phenylobacterium sp.]